MRRIGRFNTRACNRSSTKRPAVTRSPFIHAGQGRFWLLPLNEFLALPPIYGQQLIADPGPDRGARSALVGILKNELPDFPQMPLNRPPVAENNIQYIRDWIDAGFPE